MDISAACECGMLAEGSRIWRCRIGIVCVGGRGSDVTEFLSNSGSGVSISREGVLECPSELGVNDALSLPLVASSKDPEGRRTL